MLVDGCLVAKAFARVSYRPVWQSVHCIRIILQGAVTWTALTRKRKKRSFLEAAQDAPFGSLIRKSQENTKKTPYQGGAVAWWVALSPHSKEGLGSIPRPGDRGPLCVEFACSPRVCMGFLRVLRFLPTVQRHAVRPIGHARLPLGVIVYVCLSALRWTGDLSRVYPAFRPMTAGIGSSTPRDPDGEAA
ncbi:hypothetical protein MHYP_G00283440 [Metynnis hypsauchen]